MSLQQGNTVYGGDSGEEINLYEPGYENVTNVYGGQGGDVLRGNRLNNMLSGGAGDDQLWGGSGSDVLQGGNGNDAYWWGRGDGADTVAVDAANGEDMLVLYNVNVGEHSSYRAGNDLYLSLGNGDTVDLQGWYAASARQRVQSFVFSDGCAYAWNNDAGAEVNLYDSIYEANGISRLKGVDGGASTLRGGSRNDDISGGAGDDQLWGGAGGADTLAGGDGWDTYWYGAGDGQDLIADGSGNSGDTIRFYNIQNSDGLALTQSGSDLVLSFSGGNSITLQNWYSSAANRVNRFIFADGSVKQIVNNSWQTIGDDSGGFQIEVDYSRYDQDGFFAGHPERQAVVEEACRIWESLINDEFENVRTGTVIQVVNPNTLTTDTIYLDQEIDDFKFYAGSSSMGGSTLGVSAALSVSNLGNSRLDNRYNGYDDIEPWVGSISINTDNANLLYFDPTPNDPYDDTVPEDKYDFLHIVLHELGHALGFGPQKAGSQYVTYSNGQPYFNGPHAVAVYGGAVPLNFDSGSHIASSSRTTSLMEPTLYSGTRVLPSALDKAIFADIGYNITGVS
ncbi:MAG TPA: calcium-binding protein [Methylomusa anaerophila]|uniref:Bifunctional hemolysin/adenylate cyclase n=1 Tax=Methylomusa anaerophila TaxID=1930071 RepID=A0A348AKR3_9FIRM|nr:calcium-binding protein [Methylomusa anaerophila]BBB91661.1 bifunctional hemolysin/adenylate cyclase precursor [Methylomusa anaerophila]HML88605.1 calcium-binding protein [Methylomusa anaerophila]